jgi:hypothetical protein
VSRAPIARCVASRAAPGGDAASSRSRRALQRTVGEFHDPDSSIHRLAFPRRDARLGRRRQRSAGSADGAADDSRTSKSHDAPEGTPQQDPRECALRLSAPPSIRVRLHSAARKRWTKPRARPLPVAPSGERRPQQGSHHHARPTRFRSRPLRGALEISAIEDSEAKRNEPFHWERVDSIVRRDRASDRRKGAPGETASAGRYTWAKPPSRWFRASWATNT